MKEDTFLKQLFAVQSHWGHQKKTRNPKLRNFIYSTVNKIDVINLDYTVIQIENSKSLIKQYTKDDILVISSRSDLELNEISVVSKWKPGMITNFQCGLLNKLPKLLIVDRANNNLIALKEAKSCGIKTIGFCDTNSSLNNIEQFIVINDDNDKAIRFVMNYLFTR